MFRSSRVSVVWGSRAVIRVGFVLGLTGAGGAALPQGIYTCVDANGKRLTSDRPIPECTAREQRVLNADGSVKRIVPPTLTADERAEVEARERQRAVERAAQQDAIRKDRNLMIRFPNEAAHEKARNAALDDLRNALSVAEKRLAALAADRKPLMDEAEFYTGRKMPLKLRQLIDANDAATDAQRAVILTQEAEVVRINALYDAELARLRKLWAGAPPGSLGPAVPPPPLAAASTPATGKKTVTK